MYKFQIGLDMSWYLMVLACACQALFKNRQTEDRRRTSEESQKENSQPHKSKFEGPCCQVVSKTHQGNTKKNHLKPVKNHQNPWKP